MNKRVGTYYAIVALTALLLAYATHPVGWILCWPAASFFVVALGYFGLGARVYGKRDGRHPVCLQFFHGWTLLGHEGSRRHYAKQCRPWDELIPGLLIGRKLNRAEADQLISEGVVAVLDLTSEFAEVPSLRNRAYLNLPILDLTAPSEKQVDLAEAFITQHLSAGKVYVHCKIGYSRTAAIAGSYLMRTGHAQNSDEAMAMLRKARPSIVIRPEAVSTIQRNDGKS